MMGAGKINVSENKRFLLLSTIIYNLTLFLLNAAILNGIGACLFMALYLLLTFRYSLELTEETLIYI